MTGTETYGQMSVPAASEMQSHPIRRSAVLLSRGAPRHLRFLLHTLVTALCVLAPAVPVNGP